MKLKKILKGVSLAGNQVIPDIDIQHIAGDSREVKPGSLFIAIKGHDEDGSKFIKDALDKGASFIVTENSHADTGKARRILITDSRSAASSIARNFYNDPSGKLKIVGVTGTNGKTTITYIIESVIRSLGKECGIIGTISHRFKDKIVPAKNTTPGPLELWSILAEMAAEGVEYAIMEVSSHSLDQRRVEGIRYDAAIFTNITSDHLDYHKTVDSYFAAKKRIFQYLKEGGTAILNIDDPKVASLKGEIAGKIMTYGIENNSDISAEDMTLSMNGSSFKVDTPIGSFHVNTDLIGRHNVSNILASIAASLSLGIDLGSIKRGITEFRKVPGRLEAVVSGQNFTVFVDYAHTEDALYNILSLLREVAGKRIITVFGCGGNRDRTKRPLMGKVACKYSDHVVITSDNPRFEDPGRIIEEIESGIKGRFSNYEVIPDRRSAIERAVQVAVAGDVVVIAGKGHEDYQIIRDKILPFDDRQVVSQILKGKHENKRYSKSNARKSAVGRS